MAATKRRRGGEDARVLAARKAHAASIASLELAGRQRAERDRLVRQLRAEDPARWTYARLADAIGCSPELVAVIIRNA